MTAHVHVQPAGVDLRPRSDEAVLRAAERLGYRWPTVCGGQGTCRTCFCEVLEGREHCSDIEGLEAEGLAALGRPQDGTWRLACQLRVEDGHVVVRKCGVKPNPR